MIEVLSIPISLTWQIRPLFSESLFQLAPRRLRPEGIRALALAVLVRAVADAAAGDGEAREWMLNESLAWFAGVGLAVEPLDLQAWASSGFYGGRLLRPREVHHEHVRALDERSKKNGPKDFRSDG